MNTPAARLGEQLFWLLVLGIPVACISWTVTREEVFREPREWFTKRNKDAASGYERKFFYLLACEYCFSHYVAAAVTALCKFRLLLREWRAYFVAWLSLVWIANLYINIFGRLRDWNVSRLLLVRIVPG
ncbi:MAG: hypothetical protein WBL50_15400 [Candidatus Acidiferrum sp.]